VKVKRKRGDMWYLKLRLPDSQWPGRTMSTRRLLGPAWTERSKPADGYYTEKMAKYELQAVLADARRGTLPKGAPGAAPTFGQAVNEWVRHVEREGASNTYVRNCESVAKRLLTPAFGADTPVASVDDQQVDALRDELMDGPLRPPTVKKTMVMLYGIMRNAQRKKWIKANPCVDAGRVKVAKPSGDYKHLSVEEVFAVARATNDEQDAALIVVAAMTGLRMGELRALRWADVDFTQRAIHVRHNHAHGEDKLPKSGKVRSLPMADQVAVALDGLSKREHFTGPGDLVFVNAYGRYVNAKELRQAFYSGLKLAGLGHKREGAHPFVFHDLRHTFGTLCARSGVPVGEIQVYMGHASLSTTEIYMHHAPKHDAAQRLTTAFSGQDSRVELVQAVVKPSLD
jgi:integrase